MLQYYTLDQAAKLLGVDADRAKKLLDDHKVRQYRDGRGGVRYVSSAVDELARSLGRGSDPELPLGEAPRAKTGNTPRPAKGEDSTDSPFEFDLPIDDSEDVAIGKEKLDTSGSASQRSSRGKKAGPKSPSPKSPPPQAGSDSDVRLVTEGSDLEFQISADSDVKMVDEADPASSKSGASKAAKPKAAAPKSVRPGDSEVRIVPLDIPSDSDVKISEDEEGSVVLGSPLVKKHSDSDIRLEEVARPAPRADEGSDDALVTEEIDLDAEERKAAAKAKGKGKGSKMRKADAGPAPLPTTSPFELSEDDIDVPATPKKPDSSSDFELTPAAEASDDEISLSSGEFEAAAAAPKGADDSSDEEVALGEISGGGAGSSGINLDAPMDSGISLEGGEGSGDEMEFELSLDAGSTPKPAPKSGPKSGKSKVSKVPKEEDSDSEFELTLDADSSAEQPVLQPVAEGPSAEDSDSEFELTLDDSGGLVPLEGEQAAAPEESAEEGDIFETDFEVPALDEESGSQAVALDESDTDLESSDFDLALEEGDASGDEESGSQVVALEDEGEVDEAAETVQRPKKKGKPAKKKAAAEEGADELLGGDEEPLEELADIDDEEAVAEDETEAAPPRTPVAAAAGAAPAPWGPVPALFLLPCLIVMLLAGLMGYELINNMLGYQQPGKVSGMLSESVAKAFDLELPKD